MIERNYQEGGQFDEITRVKKKKKKERKSLRIFHHRRGGIFVLPVRRFKRFKD